METELFTKQDYPILIQWVAMVIPLLFVGVRSFFEDGVIDNKLFIIIILVCNVAIIFSVYDDILLFLELFKGEKDLFDNKSILFYLNFSPIVGIGRLFALGSLVKYYSNIDNTKPLNKFIQLPMLCANIIVILPALILAFL